MLVCRLLRVKFFFFSYRFGLGCIPPICTANLGTIYFHFSLMAATSLDKSFTAIIEKDPKNEILRNVYL